MKKEMKRGELCSISVDIVENGFSISCSYEDVKKNSLSRKAGWVPQRRSSEGYVAKTKAEVLKHIKEVL